MKLKLLQRLLGVSALVMVSLSSLPSQAAAISNVVIFGDSLSDSGNNFLAGLYNPAQVISGNTYIPSFTYDKGSNAFGTYSNGPTWASDFTAGLGLSAIPSLAGGSNYAFGGAVTSGAGFPYSLSVQVGQFLTKVGNTAPSDALYVVAGGGNNARAAGTALAVPGLSFAQQIGIISANASHFATDIGNMVDTLQAAGAHNIVVWNAPNLGTTPFANATGTQGIGTLLASTMNEALAYRLASEPDVKTFDLFGLVGQVIANPAAFGISNYTDACGAAINSCNPATALFWDAIHPTAKGHEVIASAMLNLVAVPVPEPESYALMVLGLLVVGMAVRRRPSV
ncbi:SGNH/GDSL hydrolase family protein [soil metagenome]